MKMKSAGVPLFQYLVGATPWAIRCSVGNLARHAFAAAKSYRSSARARNCGVKNDALSQFGPTTDRTVKPPWMFSMQADRSIGAIGLRVFLTQPRPVRGRCRTEF